MNMISMSYTQIDCQSLLKSSYFFLNSDSRSEGSIRALCEIQRDSGM